MTWQVHTERVKVKLAREITVQLKRGKKDNRARLIVYLCKAIMEKVKWKAKEPIGLLIGEDEDNSKIRVIRIAGQNNAPPQVTFVSRALKGSARCDFGFIEKLGSEAKPACDAANVEIIDLDTIEITLPNEDEWINEIAEIKQSVHKDIIETKTIKPPFVLRETNEVENPNFYRSQRGIVISTAKESEAVTFKGKTTDLTLKQAILLEAMERTAPEPCDREFIARKIFGIKPPPTANDVMRTMISSLTMELSKMGLRIKIIGSRPSQPDAYVLEIV